MRQHIVNALVAPSTASTEQQQQRQQQQQQQQQQEEQEEREIWYQFLCQARGRTDVAGAARHVSFGVSSLGKLTKGGSQQTSTRV